MNHTFITLYRIIISCILVYFIDYFSYNKGINKLFSFLYVESLNMKINNKIIKFLLIFKPLTELFFNRNIDEFNEINELKECIFHYFEKNNLDGNDSLIFIIYFTN